ncbi:hypothetical protein DSM07_03460 [Oenococcus sp. UCMA 16435]|nr:hypothetical protein DSM07_03460 [Oenococcus sp. UCMA 16435]
MLFVPVASDYILGKPHGGNLMYGILPLIVSTMIFLLTIAYKEFHSKFTNLLASTVFSAYLITEQEILRPVLWKMLALKNVSNIWIADITGFIIIIFLLIFVISLIDLLRQYLFRILKINDFSASIIEFLKTKMNLFDDTLIR